MSRPVRTNASGAWTLVEGRAARTAPRAAGQPRKERTMQLQNGTGVIDPLSNYKAGEVSWLWQDRLARGKLTLIAGDPGLGKSYVTLDFASSVSNGYMGDRPGGTLILSAEDHPGDTIRPRLERIGANIDRIHVMAGVKYEDRLHAVRLDRDMDALIRAAHAVPNLRLVVVDPVSAYMGKADSNNNAEVRALLHELSLFAERAGVAVVCVTHLNKADQNPRKAVYRAMGSLAFTAAARMVWMVSRHPDDPDKRVMSLVKSNIGPQVPPMVFTVRGGRFEWLDEKCSLDADTIEGGGEMVDQVSAVEEAESFLRQLLADGPVQAADGIFQAATLGITERTLARARRRIGVVARKRSGNWDWVLEG